MGLALAIFISSCGKKAEPANTQKTNEAIPVKVIALKKTEMGSSLFASGQFTTDDETLLSFKTGGVIQKIYVKEGDNIHKGQILASLNLTEITAQVNQAQIALNKAARDYKRLENLFKDSVTTLEQLQNAKTGLELTQQQLASAKFNLNYSEIRATQDGVVLQKMAQEGQVISAGTPVLQTNSKGSSDWILRIAVSDKAWATTHLKDKALVSIEALNMQNIEGMVSAKSENADPATGSFNIDIKLSSTKNLNIASGMFGKTEIIVSQKNNGWRIPYDALLDGNANNGFVFVTNDDKVAKKVAVKIAGIYQNTVLINEGLSDYKSLIVSGSAYLTDQSVITLVKP